MQSAWAYWIVGGIVLMLAELAIGALFIFWFGLGALLVGMLVWLMPGMSLVAQILIWTVASLIFVALWFKLFKPQLMKPHIHVGQSHAAALGEIGLVTRDIKPFQKGQVQFQKPIMGDDRWEAIADSEIAAGERAEVVAVQGNLIKVKALSGGRTG